MLEEMPIWRVPDTLEPVCADYAYLGNFSHLPEPEERYRWSALRRLCSRRCCNGLPHQRFVHQPDLTPVTSRLKIFSRSSPLRERSG